MSDFSCKQKGCFVDITCSLGHLDKRSCEYFLHGCLSEGDSLEKLIPIGFRLEDSDHTPIYRREDVIREVDNLSIDGKVDVRILRRPGK